QAKKTDVVPAKVETQTSKKVSEQVLDPAINELSASIWPDVLTAVKKKYNTLYGVLRMAEPEFTDDTITLRLSFSFHQKRLDYPKNKRIIADAIKQLTKQPVKVVCVVEKSPQPKPIKPSEELDVPNPPENSPLGTISNI